jgi:hypothetical protein
MVPRRDRKRHGIVVALAGWYLISPAAVQNPNGQPVLVDVNRPLREWKIERSFDTVGMCQSYRNGWIIEQRTEAEKRSKPVPPNVVLEANIRANSRCVASDDVHLPK